MKYTPSQLTVMVIGFAQIGSLVAWYIGFCLWAGGEAWLAGGIIGIPAAMIASSWFKQITLLKPLAWIALFLWFLATVAFAATRLRQDFLAHPVALLYAVTSIVAWLMMWHRTVRPVMLKTRESEQ